jgi:phosphoribosylanthranilate isomerase
VPGTPRALEERVAAGIIGAIRSAASPALPIVGVTVDRDPDDANALARRLDLDALQLHGAEPPEAIRRYERPAWKVSHLPPECAMMAVAAVTAAAATVERADLPDCRGHWIMLDTSGGPFPGGTGAARRPSWPPPSPASARGPGRRPRPGTVAGTLLAIPAIGVDVASGVERRVAMGRSLASS